MEAKHLQAYLQNMNFTDQQKAEYIVMEHETEKAKMYKWFAGVMLLFCIVFISGFCYKNNPVCSPTGIDATQALSERLQQGKEQERTHIMKEIDVIPCDNRGCVNKEQLIRALNLVNNNFK